MAKKQEKQENQLTSTKVDQLNRQPVIETQTKLSDDKKWVIHRTVITDIKPMSYMKKVMV